MLARTALAVLGLLVVVTAQHSIGSSLRGVNPALSKYYSSDGGTFQCIDGSKTMPFTRVNDGYCDCLDGSDEPGTAACPNGKFYCVNVGYQPLNLNSSMVDDGVCDCCDGTDEQAGICSNRCEELGSMALQALREELAAVEVGLKRKEQYMRTGQRNKVAWKKRLSALAGLESKASKSESVEQGRKKKLERQQRALQDRKHELEELLKSLEPQPEPEQPAPAAEDDATAAASKRSTASRNKRKGSRKHNGEDLDGSDAEVLGQEAEAALSATQKEETEEERAKRVAAQWIPGANKDSKQEEENDDEDSPDDEEDFDSSYNDNSNEIPVVNEDGVDDHVAVDGEDDMDADDGGDYEGGELIEDIEEFVDVDDGPKQREEPAEEQGPVSPPILDQCLAWFIGMGQRLKGSRKERAELASTEWMLKRARKRVNAANKAVMAASDRSSSLSTEKATLEKNLNQDFGEGSVYSALLGKCFEAQVDKYTYKVCPYDKAQQDYSSLGTWSGFEENYTVMKFTGGQNCWSGPDRSMTVKVKCGKTEELSKVAEPSRCEYTAQLVTPAACTAAMADSIREQLVAKGQILAEAAAAHSELK